MLYIDDLFPAHLNPCFVCCFVIKLLTVTKEHSTAPFLQPRTQTYNFLGTWNIRL